MSKPRSNTGRKLQREWSIPAQHVLYHHQGKWFHVLEKFPGALCDPSGYVLFDTKEEFEKSPYLSVGKHVRATNGINDIPSYVKVR